MNLKVGDKVKIINRGKIYSTYLEWVESYVKSKKLQLLFDAGNFYLDGYGNDIFTVKANALHNLNSNLMLYYIQNDRTKKCYIIEKKGIELINESRHFKSLPNDYTGKIEVENGIIKEKEILDEAEKRYLKAVIRPFKNRINHISKNECNDGDCYISVDLDDEVFDLPYFKKGTMYNGMEEEKGYTLKELGVDE